MIDKILDIISKLVKIGISLLVIFGILLMIIPMIGIIIGLISKLI